MASLLQARSSESALTARLSETSSAVDLQEPSARQCIDLPNFQDVVAGPSPSYGTYSWPAADWSLPEASLRSAEASICSMFQDESCSSMLLEEANHCATSLPQLDLAAPDFADLFFQADDAEQFSSAITAT